MKTISLFIPALIIALSSCRPGSEPARPPVQLGEDVKETIRTTLSAMAGPVTLHFYQGGAGATAERETRAILEFMATAAPQISLLNHSLDADDNAADQGISPGVDHGPVVVIEGANRGSLIFYGFPERKELAPFLDGVLFASGKQKELPAEAEDFLSSLDQNVRIRIFTAPD